MKNRPHERGTAYPNVAPEPSIYWPSVLITPLGPAPYLMMFTEPAESVSSREQLE